MTYAYVQDVPITEDVYRKIVAKLGPEPLEGLIVHLVVVRADKRLRYIDVWESQVACDRAFAERIHPAVFSVFQEVGFRPDGEPARERIDVIDVAMPPAAKGR